MFSKLKEKVASVLSKEKKDDADDFTPLPYQTVPLTVALRKRKYEEEQFAMYGLQKERSFSLESIE